MQQFTKLKPEESKAVEDAIRRLSSLAAFSATAANHLETGATERVSWFDPTRAITHAYIDVLEVVGNHLHNVEPLHEDQLLTDADLVRIQQARRLISNAVDLIRATGSEPRS